MRDIHALQKAVGKWPSCCGFPGVTSRKLYLVDLYFFQYNLIVVVSACVTAQDQESILYKLFGGQCR